MKSFRTRVVSSVSLEDFSGQSNVVRGEEVWEGYRGTSGSFS